MPRRIIFLPLLALASSLLLALLVTSAAGSASSTSCTAAQKAQRQAVLRAYQGKMSSARKTYFKAHEQASLRAAFVKAQQAKLAGLRRAAACVVSQPAPPPSPPPPTGPVPAPAPGPNEAFSFGSEMSATAQDEIKGDVAYAVQDEAVLLGAPITSVRTFASSNPDWLADQLCRFIGAGSNCFSYAGGNPAASASHGGIFLNWASQSWTYGAAQNQKIIAHELFHIFQFQLDKLSDAPAGSAGPVWLLEGSAEMVGYHVAVDRRLFPSYASALAGQIGGAKQISTPLSSLETRDAANIPNVYSLFNVAVDHLVTVAPRGLPALTAYYNALGAGMAWQEAFRASFGMSVEAYYANFAAYRAGL